jgi:hypothetical protein
VSALCGKAEKLLQEVKVATEQKASTPASTPAITPVGSTFDEPPKSFKDPDELWELKMRLNKVELELDKRKSCGATTDTQQSLPEDVHFLKAQLQETQSNLSEAQLQLRDAQEQIRALEKKFTGSSTGGCLSPASSSGSFTPVAYGVRPGHGCSGCSGGTSTPPATSSPYLSSRSARALTHIGSILESSPRVTATLVPVQRRTSTRPSSAGDVLKPTISRKSLFRPILASVRAQELRWQQLAQQQQRL